MKKSNVKYVIALIIFVMSFFIYEGYVKLVEYNFTKRPEVVENLYEDFYNTNPDVISLGKYYDMKPVLLLKNGSRLNVYLEVVCKNYSVKSFSASLSIKDIDTHFVDVLFYGGITDYFHEIDMWYIPMSMRFSSDVINEIDDKEFEIRVKISYRRHTVPLSERVSDYEEWHTIVFKMSDLYDSALLKIENICTNHELYSENLESFFMGKNIDLLHEIKANEFPQWYAFIEECIANYDNTNTFHKYFLDNYGRAVFFEKAPESEMEEFNKLKKWMEENVPGFARE